MPPDCLGRNTKSFPQILFLVLLQKAMTPEEVLSKQVICDPITIAMSAPTGDGGAAAVVCSEEFVRRHKLEVS